MRLVIAINANALSDWIGIWKCWFFEERGKLEYLEKNLSEQGTRSSNKHNPHVLLSRGIEPRPHWWEANGLTTTPTRLLWFTYTLSLVPDPSLESLAFFLPSHGYYFIPTDVMNAPCQEKIQEKQHQLRTVPTFVTAHAFCASRDTQVSYGWCLLIQGYFCAV